MTEGSTLDKKQGKEKLAGGLGECKDVNDVEILIKSKNNYSRKYLNMKSRKRRGYGQRTECWS